MIVSERQQSAYEPSQGSHAPCEFHQVLFAPGRLHEADGIDLGGVSFDAPATDYEAE